MLARSLKLIKTNSFFLFGPRQTGKSSLIGTSFNAQDTIFVNLLLAEEYRPLKQNPELFRTRVSTRPPHIKFVVVDEIQRIPELLNEIHHLIESPNPPVFAITGSSTRKLRRADVNLLGGRAWRFDLFPLTHEELGDKFDLHRCLEVGTLPAIYLSTDAVSTGLSLKSYVDNYIREEIEAEAATRNLSAFFKFLPIVGECSGKQLNFSKIARVCVTTPNTIKSYFKILEDTLVGRFLYPLSGSTRQQLSKHPKFYLFDTGVQRAILGRENSRLNIGTYEYGDLFESWVINEIWRLNSYYRKNLRTSFFRLDRGAEVDLVIQTPDNKTYGIEIESAETVPVGELRGGFAALERETPLTAKICIAPVIREYSEDGVRFLPVSAIASFVRGL
jgi:predicted AAA+ superfamily ATPase